LTAVTGSRRTERPGLSRDGKYPVVIVDQSIPGADAFVLTCKGHVPEVRAVDITSLVEARWSQTITDNHTSWSARFADGSSLTTNAIRCLLMAAPRLPATSVTDIATEDRRFAYDEMVAALCGLLADSTGRHINFPTPPNIAGQYLNWEQWIRMAHAAGMPTPETSSHTYALPSGQLEDIYLIGTQMISDVALPAHTVRSLKSIQSQLPAQKLMQITLDVSRTEAAFVSGTTSVDLLNADNRAVEALMGLLK
jgi:hypothetical protein